MDKGFFRSKGFVAVALVGGLGAPPLHAAENAFFWCTPVKFSKMVVFGDVLENVPCAGKTQAQLGTTLCNGFRMELDELTASGGFYVYEGDHAASDGTPIHISVRLSRSAGAFRWVAKSSFGESERSGTCELMRERLKY